MLEPLTAGRIQRAAGELLCDVGAGSQGLSTEWSPVTDRTPIFRANCKAYLKIAERFCCEETTIGKRRTYDPGECWNIVADAGFGVSVFGSWFSLSVTGKLVPGALGFTLPRSGRVPISELTEEIRRAEVYRQSLAA